MDAANGIDHYLVYTIVASKLHTADLPKSSLFITFKNKRKLLDVLIFSGFTFSIEKKIKSVKIYGDKEPFR